MTRLTASGRQAAEATHTELITFCLMQITHTALSTPVRISTMAQERLTDDPVTYGVRSTWLGANPATEPFVFLGISYEWPGNFEGEPGEARMIVDGGNLELMAALSQIHTPPTLQMAKFTTADINTPEPGQTLADMRIRMAGSNGETLQLTAGWYPSWLEGPAHFMDPQSTPGLHFQ